MKLHENFNYERWRENADINPTEPPYWDRVDHARPYGKKYGLVPCQRVFVCADFFPRWESWRLQAQLAADAALMGEDFRGQAFRRSDALPLTNKPAFLIERGRFSELRIWLNVCLSDFGEAAFNEAKQAARARCDELRRAAKNGIIALSASEQPKYDPRENATDALAEQIRRQTGQSYVRVEA